MKKRLENLKKAFLAVLTKLKYILIKPVLQLKVKCCEMLLLLAATMISRLGQKLEKLTKKLAKMELY